MSSRRALKGIAAEGSKSAHGHSKGESVLAGFVGGSRWSYLYPHRNVTLLPFGQSTLAARHSRSSSMDKSASMPAEAEEALPMTITTPSTRRRCSPATVCDARDGRQGRRREGRNGHNEPWKLEGSQRRHKLGSRLSPNSSPHGAPPKVGFVTKSHHIIFAAQRPNYALRYWLLRRTQLRIGSKHTCTPGSSRRGLSRHPRVRAPLSARTRCSGALPHPPPGTGT